MERDGELELRFLIRGGREGGMLSSSFPFPTCWLGKRGEGVERRGR